MALCFHANLIRLISGRGASKKNVLTLYDILEIQENLRVQKIHKGKEKQEIAGKKTRQSAKYAGFKCIIHQKMTSNAKDGKHRNYPEVNLKSNKLRLLHFIEA